MSANGQRTVISIGQWHKSVHAIGNCYNLRFDTASISFAGFKVVPT